jgi:hypothetical protein
VSTFNDKPNDKPKNKRKNSKADLRSELEQATQQFLHGGGAVTEIPTGTSAWVPGSRPPPAQPLFTQPREERTPLTEVVVALEERRAAQRARRTPTRTRKVKAKQKVIYDDFGEPLRKVWSDTEPDSKL